MGTDDETMGRGVAFPVSVDARGGLADAAGGEKVRQSILLVLGTEPGERLMRPDFGCPLRSLVFAPNSQATARLAEFHFRDALARWVPRIVVNSVVVDNTVDCRSGPHLS